MVDCAGALAEYVQGGAVLVRPDGHVAWRAATTECPEAQLRAALDLTLAGSPRSARRRDRVESHTTPVRSHVVCDSRRSTPS